MSSRLRYPLAQPDLRGKERRYLLDAVGEGTISSIGRQVGELETAFAGWMGAPIAAAVSSGTAAVHLALSALGIGRGDEVIVPDLTYVASVNAVAYTGAHPVLVDVDPSSWTIDPAAVRDACSSRTRAILAVHLYGTPADLGALSRIAREKGVRLIEDAAQALGARWRGKAVGAVGDAGCFSFYGNKVITTGEGGMVVSRRASLHRRLRHLRNQAAGAGYHHDEVGFNYRMTALQAAVGLAQLERVDTFLHRRQRIAAWYRAAMAGLPGWEEPTSAAGGERINWLFTVRMRDWSARRRDRCLEALRRHGVDSRPGFVPMSRLPMYRAARQPVAGRLADEILSLPTYPGLKRSDVAAIVEALRASVQSRNGR